MNGSTLAGARPQEDEESREALGSFLNGSGANVLWASGSEKDPLRLSSDPPPLPLKKRGIYLLRLGEGKLEKEEVLGRVLMGDVGAATPVLDQALRATQEVTPAFVNRAQAHGAACGVVGLHTFINK